MDSPAKIFNQLKRRVQSVTYGSPLYRMMLDQGPIPNRVRLSLVDPWPGDAKQGQNMIASQTGLFDPDQAPSFVQKKKLLTHDGLRDLRALGTDIARRHAVALIQGWMDGQEQWDEDGWSPPILGARLANWIGFYDFYSPASNREFEQNFLTSSVRQLRHLQHTALANLTQRDGLYAIKGLIYGGLALIDKEKALGLALDLLGRQLDAEILPDGCHISRNPLMHAEILRVLIDIRSALCAGKLEVPHELSLAITRMVPVLKFFRHGDGCLALFNGSTIGVSLLLDATLTLSEVRGRILKRLTHSGYERVTAGRSLLITDVGGPPPYPYDTSAHAGLLSFEFSAGRERIITNCGASLDARGDWSQAMAATAAHNTVILEDTNACELLPDGGVGHRPREVTSQRYEQEEMQFIESTHDGYGPRYKAKIQRTLGLDDVGSELMGREVVVGPVGRNFAIRWHIHPDVNVLLAQGGSSALLRTPSGSGWRLRIKGNCGASLALESSVYCGEGVPRRTLQLRVSGRIRENPAIVEWTLAREKTKKGSER